MDKSVSIKESETIENYPENADIDGDVLTDGKIIWNVPDRALFRLYHHHGFFRLYADLRQYPRTHGLAEGSEQQI